MGGVSERGNKKAYRLSETGEHALMKSLRITAVYLLFGCVWILTTDSLTGAMFADIHDVVTANIVKGLFYVLITSALIFLLIFPAMKKLIKSEASLKKVNTELEETNAMYKGLYEEYVKKGALLKSLVDSIPDIIFYKGNDLSYMGCNKAFVEFFGKPETDVIGHTDYDIFGKERADLFRTVDIDLLEMKYAVKKEVKYKHPDGRTVCFETIKTPYYDSEGNLIGIIGISRDITQRKHEEEKIRYLNRHDLLTGLYNRAVFQEKQAELDTEENLPLSVIIGDINGLKLINDSLGHSEGDRLIVEIAGILKACCGGKGVVARVGGDEFAILLPKTGEDEVKAVAEEITLTCEKRHAEDGNIFHITNISLGFATKRDAGESLQKLIHSAEEFMYRHKLFEYKSLHNSILSSLKSTMFEKSCETEEHAERMSVMAKKLGKALGLPGSDIDSLELLSTLHDIGKISVDKRILTKSGKLTDEEWHEIRRHPEVGYRICQASPEFMHVSEYILSHHERWDGGGYPQGLKGEEIPLLSRIISIIDAFDAMTQDRSYRKAMSVEKAVEEIRLGAGTQFDPNIAAIFINQVVKDAG